MFEDLEQCIDIVVECYVGPSCNELKYDEETRQDDRLLSHPLVFSIPKKSIPRRILTDP